MKRKVNKIMAVFILICMVMTSMPLNVFAIENRETYTQIQLNGAIGVETDSKTVSYEHGTVMVNDPNAILIEENEQYFLYTQQESLGLSFDSQNGWHLENIYIDGNMELVQNDSYTLTGLETNTHVNFDVNFAQDGNQNVSKAEIELRGAIGVNEGTGIINYDGASVTVSGDGIEFKSENGFDEQAQLPITIYFLVTTGNSITFTLNGEYDNIPTLLFNGARENFVDNQYVLGGLNSESRIIFELDTGSGNNNNPQEQNNDNIEIQFDNATVNGNILTFNVNGQDITAEVVGAEVDNGRIVVDRNDLYNVEFVLSSNFDSETMQAVVRGENEYQGILTIKEGNIATFEGLFVGQWLHFSVEGRPGGDPQGPGYNPVDPPVLENGFLSLNMTVGEHATGNVKYYFVDDNNMYLQTDGTVINEQKQPAGEITTEDEVMKVAIPDNAVKVLLGIEEGNATSAGTIEIYNNDNAPYQVDKDEMKYGRTIEIPYNSGDSIGLTVSWMFWVPDEEFYPEEQGTYLITDFMGNNEAIVKYKDVNNEEQILDSSKNREAVQMNRNVSLVVPECTGHIQVDVYDENMNLLVEEAGDIRELTRYGERDLDTYFDDWIMDLNCVTFSTLDLSSLNEDYTVVVRVNLVNPDEAYMAHVLTWTNMRGSGWGDDALIDGGFAKLVKAYDRDGNLIYDADEKYSEDHYYYDEVRGERTNKFVYGEPMEYFWERGTMYEFAVSQEDDGGEVEAVEGIQLVFEFTPVYGKQLVEVSLGEDAGSAEGDARYYKLTMPAGHVHFNARFEDVNNEALLADNTDVVNMMYELDQDALDSGTAVLSIDRASDLTQDQIDSFAEIAGDDYEVTTYLDVGLKQVWFKGVNAQFDYEHGYSDDDVWSADIHDLGNKKATITVELDGKISPEDVVVLHELHDENEIIGYEAVNIVNKEKNQEGVWTVTFEASKFSNYAIASKLGDTPDMYNVTFDTDGGTLVDAQQVVSGENAYYPETNPTKDGYIFDGWYEDEFRTVEFEFWNTPITKDTTVYAKWTEIIGEINEINVSVKAPQVGDRVEMVTIYVEGFEHNEPSIVPDITIHDHNLPSFGLGTAWINGTSQEYGEGYDQFFEGTFEEDTYYYAGIEFYAPDGYVINSDINININGEAPAEIQLMNEQTCVRFIAKIKSIPQIPEYTVSFDTMGGSEIESQQVESGEYLYSFDDKPTREGYIFDGWYEDELGTIRFEYWNTPITNDITVYAKWIKIEGSITDVNLTFKAPQIGDSSDKRPTVKTGSNGYYTDYYAYVDTWLSEPMEEGESPYEYRFEGVFEENTDYYALIFLDVYMQGYILDPNANILVNGEVPVRVLDTGDNTSALLIVKVRSIEKLPTYEVTFDTNGILEVETQYVESDECAHYPEENLAKEGYMFYGWYEDPLYTVEFEFWNTPITKDTTVYGKWVEIIGEVNSIDITLDAPKAGETVELVNHDYGGYGELIPSVRPNAYTEKNVNYIVEETIWYDLAEEIEYSEMFEGAFEEGKEYGAVIEVMTKEGYVFGENVAMTVNGEPIDDVFPMGSEIYRVVVSKVVAVADNGQQDPEPPAHVHEMELVAGVAATCMTSGHSAYYKCDGCGKYFEDETGTTEIADITTMNIAALGHDWNDWTVTKEPTVTETGLKVRTCKNDPNHKEEEVLARVAVKVEADDVAQETAKPNKVKEAASEVINAAMAGEEVKGIDEELKAEIIDAANNGKTVKVDLAVAEVNEAAIAEDVEKVEAILPEGAEIGQYFDIDVLLKVDDEVKGNITELANEIEIGLPIPEDLPEVEEGYVREFTVIRVHDGIATALKTDVKGDNVVFKTSQFSTYALTYKDVLKPVNSNNPTTSDPIMIYVAVVVISLASITVITCSKKTKKVQK